jgi:hypothetical protein
MDNTNLLPQEVRSHLSSIFNKTPIGNGETTTTTKVIMEQTTTKRGRGRPRKVPTMVFPPPINVTPRRVEPPKLKGKNKMG